MLVGHSMGVSWPAAPAHYGEKDGHAWTQALRYVVCLGSPHMGAPLERAARGSHWLSRMPETAPLARVRDRAQCRRRGPPLRRLPGGLAGVDPDAWGPDRCADFPFLPARPTTTSARRSRATGTHASGG